MYSKRFLLLVAAAMLPAVFLASCSAKAEEPQDSGELKVLRVALPGSLSTIDINQEAGIFNYYISSLCQEGLVSISGEGAIEPALAESWEDDDATVWKFKIREGAMFQDGTPVTADDVVYCIQRASDPVLSPGTSVYFPSYLKSVAKTGEYEITITLDGPHAGFLWSVSNTGGLFVTSKSFAEMAGNLGSPEDLVMGSGPYQVTEFRQGKHVILESVDTWWGGRPEIDIVRIDFITDEDVRLDAFKRGNIDFTINVPAERVEEWAAVDGAVLKFMPDRSYQGITFDASIPPFDDIHVRRAIAYAIDRQAIVDDILMGHAEVATAISSPEQFAADMDRDEAAQKISEVFYYGYSMEKAKGEMALSTVPKGFAAEISYPDSYPDVGRASRMIAEKLKQIGIELNVREISLEQWLNDVGDGEQGMAWMIYVPTSAEPGEITSWLLDARGQSTNPANWYDSEVAELTARVGVAQSLEEQIELILEANSIAQEAAIYVPVYWGRTAIAFGKGVSADTYSPYTLLTKWALAFDVPATPAPQSPYNDVRIPKLRN
ncbi:MAG: ABC transporter substrate-binding protein [Clostridiales Family XIII bacterium]|jgi:peptide/nickel transport system substrate-binding protein|nr:ABC transporter substrate-binding protein [Clostridiales Family XIII bacterium]